MTNDRFKKAAILIASLDPASADALLDDLDPEEATQVRNAVMELGEIDPDEQQRVIHDFVHRGTAPTEPDYPGVELDPSLAEKLGQPSQPTFKPPTDSPREEVSSVEDDAPAPFGFLESVTTHALANILARENPQTTAIVVAHLAPERAADVLRSMPPSLQTEILVRIAHLDRPAEEVIRDIEQEIKSLLAKDVNHDTIGEEGLAAVEAILRAAPTDERQTLIHSVARRDTTLGHHLGHVGSPGDATVMPQPVTTEPSPRTTASLTPPPETWNGSSGVAAPDSTQAAGNSPTFNFAEMENLDDRALAQVLHSASPNTTLLALAGASHDFVQRILGQLPARQAARLRRKMQHLGPLRLDDVERAQMQLAALAQQLINDGKLASPSTRRFAVAA